MAKSKQEQLLIETMKVILEQNDLGGTDPLHSHHVQFQWEDIRDAFALAIKNSDFFDALNAAFYKVHSYKWIEDSTFEESLISDLESMGIPHKEIELALTALDKVRKKFVPGKKNEKAVGWPENMDEINKDMKEPEDTEVTDTKKDTYAGKREPFTGVQPDNTRPIPSEA